jgi:6-phosphogluconolactonase
MESQVCGVFFYCPDCQTLYCSDCINHAAAGFSVSSSDDSLVVIGYFDGGGAVNFPRSMTIDSTGTLLVVGNQKSNSVAVFLINQVTGELSIASTFAVTFPAFFVGFMPAASTQSAELDVPATHGL